MVAGRKGIGSHKHGVSGHSGLSPRERLRRKREAEKQEARRKHTPTFGSIKELMNKERKK